MARIRTIKPEFWTDEKIIQLTPLARLLFLGMLNYADDHGGIESSEPQLKMRILPADPVDVHDLLKELLAHGLLIEYSVNDARYYHIKNFTKHQKINRPSNPRVPPYPSLNTHGGLTEGSSREGKGSGMEGKRKGSGSGSALALGALEAPAHRDQLQPLQADLTHKILGPVDKGNGKGVVEEDDPVLNLCKILPKPKYQAAVLAYTNFKANKWTRDQVYQHLEVEAHYAEEDFFKVEFLFPEAAG